MSNAFDLRIRTCAWRIPWAVALSVSSGVPVGGWGWPISVSAVIMGTASCALRNSAPVSASEAEAATVRRVLHKTWMAPLGVGNGGVLAAPERLERKIKPAVRLRAFGNAASEQTERIMLLT